MGLEELIKEYKDISFEILNNLNNDNFDFLDEMLDKRGKIISNMSMLKYDSEEVKNIYVKYEVGQLDKLIMEKMELKKGELREKIFDIKRRRQGAKSYNNLNTKAVFLSREI